MLVDHRLRMFRSMRRGSTRQLDEVGRAYRLWIRREIRAHRFVAFVAVTADRERIASGGVWLQPFPPRPGRLKPLAVPYLMSMYTDPSHRHSGAATAIIRAAIHWARERGFTRLILHASRFGRPLYRRLGFVRGWEMRMDLPMKTPRRGRPS